MTPGDLTMAKPELNPRRDNGTAEQPRPRTIQEALARQQDNRIARPENETGGRHAAAGFGAIAGCEGRRRLARTTAAFIEAVQHRWYDLLDNIGYDGYRHGKVVLQFHLNYDGRITDMKVVGKQRGRDAGFALPEGRAGPVTVREMAARNAADGGSGFSRVNSLHFITTSAALERAAAMRSTINTKWNSLFTYCWG